MITTENWKEMLQKDADLFLQKTGNDQEMAVKFAEDWVQKMLNVQRKELAEKPIIQEFVLATPKWVEVMTKFKSAYGDSCMVCGMRASSMEDLYKTLLKFINFNGK